MQLDICQAINIISLSQAGFQTKFLSLASCASLDLLNTDVLQMGSLVV